MLLRRVVTTWNGSKINPTSQWKYMTSSYSIIFSHYVHIHLCIYRFVGSNDFIQMPSIHGRRKHERLVAYCSNQKTIWRNRVESDLNIFPTPMRRLATAASMSRSHPCFGVSWFLHRIRLFRSLLPGDPSALLSFPPSRTRRVLVEL